jgi:hypothetical protein
MRECAEVWIDCIDEQGMATLDHKKMEQFIKQRRAAKKLKRQVNKGQAGKKKKF